MKPMAAAGNKLKERFRVYRERSPTCRRDSRNVHLGEIQAESRRNRGGHVPAPRSPGNTFVAPIARVASTKTKTEIARRGGAFSIPRRALRCE